MPGRYLYHTTESEKIPSILAGGLQPSVGQNSAMAGDTDPCVSLCEEDQAAAWAAILGTDAFIRVDTDGLGSLDLWTYSGMTEYRYANAIPPERLSVTSCDLAPDVAAELCQDYVMSVSETAVDLFRLLDRKNYDETLASEMKLTIRNMALILPRLPWEHASPKAIVKALKNEGDEGEYTMCDLFKNTGRKFWELLDDPAVPGGSDVVRELKTRLGKPFEKLCTGGWDGYDE